MSCNDLTDLVAAAATAQVKLCPHDEEEHHIYFHLIEAQFAGGRDQIPKTQVCQCSDQPAQASPLGHFRHTRCLQRLRQAFWLLKKTLHSWFRNSKWQSYFELLHLPLEMQGLKPRVLIRKLKQHLPPGVSPDNDLFLAMFLIRLLSSMREATGVGTHTTAAAMVKAADALWDTRGGHNPTFTAALTQCSRSPAHHSGKRGDKKSSNACSRSRPFGAASRWSRNRFPTRRGGFCSPGTGAITGATDKVPDPSMGTTTELDLWPLLLPAEARAWGEPCGHLPTPLFDSQTSRVYSNNPVQYLYLSCYVTVNKPVLSCLSLRFLPQYIHCSNRYRTIV